MTIPVAPTTAIPSLAAGVSTDTSRLATRENLGKAGERFEAIFVNMMLTSMRKTKLADSLFESNALDQFRDMQDQQLAQNMATTTPLGIGRAMTEFLGRNQDLAETPAADAPAPGGKAAQ